MSKKRNMIDDELQDNVTLKEIVHDDRRKKKDNSKDEKRDKSNSKKRVAVWIKEEVLAYEDELKDFR